MKIAFLAALASVALAVALACDSQDECGSQDYCDEFNNCVDCSFCWVYEDPVERKTGPNPGCPAKCRTPGLQCEADSHCGDDSYCTQDNTCDSCASCFENNNGVNTEFGFPCQDRCKFLGFCASDEDCGVGNYCDSNNRCFTCRDCFTYDDALSGECPSWCRDQSLECQSDYHCVFGDYCASDNSCKHCRHCDQGNDDGLNWPCVDSCAGVPVDTTTTMPSGQGLSSDTTTGPSEVTTDDMEMTTEEDFSGDDDDQSGDDGEVPGDFTSEPRTVDSVGGAAPTVGTPVDPSEDEESTSTATSTSTSTSTSSFVLPDDEESTTSSSSSSSASSSSSTILSTSSSSSVHTSSSVETTTTEATTTTTTTTTETTTTTTEDRDCGLYECHTCEQATQQCTICKNGRFLLDGQCFDECPEPYTGTGRGNFFRSCEMLPACRKGQDFCHTCSDDQTECELCYGGRFLHNGECLESCPDGFDEEGFGSFNKRCVNPAEQYACSIMHCHRCEDGVCTMCRDEMFLHNGTCVDSCPAGMEEAGRGVFNKRCIDPADKYACSIMHCHRCRGDVCTMCRDSKYLEGGACVDECPWFRSSQGYGRFNRQCVDHPLTCVPKKNDCHECELRGSGCALCKNGKYLHSGVCVTSCPDGFNAAGQGLFGRRCEPNI